MTYAFMMINSGPVGIHVRRQGTGGAAKEKAQEQSLAQKCGIAHRRHRVKDEHTQGQAARLHRKQHCARHLLGKNSRAAGLGSCSKGEGNLTKDREDSQRVGAGIWARDSRNPPNSAAVSTARLPPVLATAVLGAAAPAPGCAQWFGIRV